jgi:hypothetical protein
MPLRVESACRSVRTNVGLDRAVQEVGMCGNQSSVCAKAPEWRDTVDWLKMLLTGWDKPSLNSATLLGGLRPAAWSVRYCGKQRAR